MFTIEKLSIYHKFVPLLSDHNKWYLQCPSQLTFAQELMQTIIAKYRIPNVIFLYCDAPCLQLSQPSFWATHGGQLV